MHSEQMELYRDFTVTPYDQMNTELEYTPKWRVIKRRHLRHEITAVNNLVRYVERTQ